MDISRIVSGIIVLALIVVLIFGFATRLWPLAQQAINISESSFISIVPGEHPEYTLSPGFYSPVPGSSPYNAIKELDKLQPDFRNKIETMIVRGQAECGLDVIVIETLRTYERSDYLHGIGRDYCRTIKDPKAPLFVNGKRGCSIVTKALAGESYHNFGLAVDLYPKKSSGDPDMQFDKDNEKMRKIGCLADIGNDMGLKWGGDFSSSLKDYPHFEEEVVTLAQLRETYPGGWVPA